MNDEDKDKCANWIWSMSIFIIIVVVLVSGIMVKNNQDEVNKFMSFDNKQTILQEYTCHEIHSKGLYELNLGDHLHKRRIARFYEQMLDARGCVEE